MTNDRKLHCSVCHMKFALSKEWVQDKWKYSCSMQDCDYVRYEKPTRDEIECFNEED